MTSCSSRRPISLMCSPSTRLMAISGEASRDGWRIIPMVEKMMRHVDRLRSAIRADLHLQLIWRALISIPRGDAVVPPPRRTMGWVNADHQHAEDQNAEGRWKKFRLRVPTLGGDASFHRHEADGWVNDLGLRRRNRPKIFFRSVSHHPPRRNAVVPGRYRGKSVILFQATPPCSLVHPRNWPRRFKEVHQFSVSDLASCLSEQLSQRKVTPA
jgi:hypothetical protein